MRKRDNHQKKPPLSLVNSDDTCLFSFVFHWLRQNTITKRGDKDNRHKRDKHDDPGEESNSRTYQRTGRTESHHKHKETRAHEQPEKRDDEIPPSTLTTRILTVQACTLSNRGSSTTAKAAKAHAASLTSIHEIAGPLSRASSMASTTALISCCTLKKSCFLSSSVDGASRRQRTAHFLGENQQLRKDNKGLHTTTQKKNA